MNYTDMVIEYNTNESFAKLKLPNRVIEACGAAAFTQVGYPTRIGTLEEAWRYADTMQEFRAEQSFAYLNGMTQAEFDSFDTISGVVRFFTEKLGRAISPTASLIRGFLPIRTLTHYCPEPNTRTILELGPGSGYCGLIAAYQGYTVYSVEVTQAFALWQRYLYKNSVCNDKLRAIDWWEWYGTTHGRVPSGPSLDAIVANHCLNEMHPNALLYNIRVAERLLKPGGVFIVEDFGSPVIRTTEATVAMFQPGWKAVRQGLVAVFAREGDNVDLENVPKPPPALDVGWEQMLEFWDGLPPLTPDEEFLKLITRVK